MADFDDDDFDIDELLGVRRLDICFVVALHRKKKCCDCDSRE